jgi:hypothetical protein
MFSVSNYVSHASSHALDTDNSVEKETKPKDNKVPYFGLTREL